MLEKEFAQQDAKAGESPPKGGESKALDESMQTSFVLADKLEEIASNISAFGSDRPLRETPGSLLPNDSKETDQSRERFSHKNHPRL